MNKWIRKSVVILVSVLTFGLISPSQLMDSFYTDKPSDRDSFEANTSGIANSFYEENHINREQFIEDMVKLAEVQSYQKFGTRIKPVIENEFREIILPNIQKAIEETAYQYPEEDLANLTITEHPAGGTSEKIFHIKNTLTGKDAIRFHVRRDNPPQAGYWFNFHYHIAIDDFHKHHDLGSIYWDKNTPPKWMS